MFHKFKSCIFKILFGVKFEVEANSLDSFTNQVFIEVFNIELRFKKLLY